MRNRKKTPIFILALGLATIFATVVIAAPLTISIDFAGFTGAGFTSGAGAPPAGQLDSDTWSTQGFGDNVAFEADCTSGDCARGSHAGGVATGGIYAFNIGSGNMILGVQPTGSDFTPGALTLRMRNNTGAPITSVDVSYDIYYFNDQSRANSLNLSYSTDNSSYTSVSSEDFTTPLTADASPHWIQSPHSVTLSGLTINDGALFYLRWTGDDNGGSGSRDEYGIDNVTVTSLDPTAVSLQSISATSQHTGLIITIIAILLLITGSAWVQLRKR